MSGKALRGMCKACHAPRTSPVPFCNFDCAMDYGSRLNLLPDPETLFPDGSIGTRGGDTQ